MSHTPGPWINDGSEVSAWVDPANAEHYIAPICTIDQDWKPSMRKANAALISAAPELLAIAIKLRDAGVWPDLFTDLDAVIKKATGEIK